MLTKINHYYFGLLMPIICTVFIGLVQIDNTASRKLIVSRAAQPYRAIVSPVQIQPSVLVTISNKHSDDLLVNAGHRIISKNWFSSIGIGIAEIAIPNEITEIALVNQLSTRFPAASVALNDRVVPLGNILPGTPKVGSRDNNLYICNSSERIGVIDGPVNPERSIFKGHSIVRKSFLENNARKSNSAHSTAVLSILMDTYSQGSSQPLNISVAEIFEQRDTGVTSSLLATVRALDWLIGQGATVINMSLQSQENAVFARILDRVAETGTIMVAAAGNQSQGNAINYPAAHPKVIAVTAIDAYQNVSPYAVRGDYVDFAAPGLNVPIATLQGTGRGSGTSYAAPFVTSVVALTLAGGAPRDVESVKWLLARKATDLGSPGKDDIFGWGLPVVETSCGRQQFSHR
jgi:hypothetical protein